ncbi:hypothetical protein CTA1_4701 [Colletotrichum tanaceti]|uniref:GPI anchored serine-threonine rich protein n=1 Tax=Colletotrichum tanaceti TaxID=1306861 RepID=A0A4U6XCF1_9PEZI|nr:hypothetical protein CTA1_4701 [Colletotrichum tanaceti]
MHLARPLFLLSLLALAAATPAPTSTPPADGNGDDDEAFCPGGTIACGPVCVQASQRCCNDPLASDFWSCESTQTCGPTKKDGCLTPPDNHRPPPSPSSSSSSSSPPATPSPSSSTPPPSSAFHSPATTVTSTTTRTWTAQTRPSSTVSQPTSTGAGQPPTCVFGESVVKRVPSENKGTPCPTSLVSSDTPTSIPPKTGMATAGRAGVVAAVFGAVAALLV